MKTIILFKTLNQVYEKWRWENYEVKEYV